MDPLGPLAPLVHVPSNTVEDADSEESKGLGRKVIALFFCFGGSLFTALFYIFGKLGHNRIAKAEKDTSGIRIFCQIPFIASVACIAIGSVSNVIALGFGNDTLVAGTSACTLIINSLLGTYLLKETLSKMDILGISIATIGSFLYVLRAKEKELNITEKELF